MVGANSSRAEASAPGWPRSTNTTCRPESSSVSGRNIGCTEVTLHPSDLSARSPARSGDLSEPTSNTTPAGRRRARSLRIASVTPEGKPWRAEEGANPAPHRAAPADDQRPPPAARPVGDDARLLLRGERG